MACSTRFKNGSKEEESAFRRRQLDFPLSYGMVLRQKLGGEFLPRSMLQVFVQEIYEIMDLAICTV